MDQYSNLRKLLPRFIDIDTFAETFGFPKATVKRWIHESSPEIPETIKIGNKRFFILDDVMEWERSKFFTRDLKDMPNSPIPPQKTIEAA